MILQRLYRDADTIMQQTGLGTLPPSMYVPKLLRWIVELSTDPRVPVAFTPLTGDDPKKGERGLQRLLPDMKRTMGITPFLLADTPSYTLGLIFADDLKGKDEAKERARAAVKHTAFKALLAACVEKTGNADVAQIERFLESWNPESLPDSFPKDMSGAHTVTFRVDGRALAVDDTLVRRFWAARGQAEDDGTSTALKATCLLSGVYGPVEEMMPVAVKGIPGGQPTGTQLVSINFAAPESYGLVRAQNSPISRDAGERFGKALNALLASERHRVTVQNIAYVFWASAPSTPRLFAFAPPADATELRHFLSSVQRGVPWCDLPSETKFQLFGLSANVARTVVRSAFDTTIGELGQAQATWFRRLQILGSDGQPGEPLSIKKLAVSAYREFKDITPGVEDALVQAALYGAKLPDSLLTTLVQRCRLDTEHRATYPRAALLKYIITQSWPLEEADKMSEEITGTMPAAYHCGRLFAELEDIQHQALPGINATIGDKFFGSASASPASVFGILLAGAQNHLSNLRKTREGAYHGAQKRLEEILSEIGDFPTTLPLKEQALFSLGYYHHRAAKRKDIAERSAAKKLATVGEEQ
ncbi:type I-C CRISPR-associated protein Cas8c/Csd1 [Armatimonas sp.]|uniref:type I-C CRISPR-associated protein Cas8c/Csd1 n=1 Tax=Armatimonas sp. TaxID=1872638 RepID=UPI00374D4551